MGKFTAASIEQYIDWLNGYIAQGRMPTHYYDYPWQRTNFLLALEDFRLGGECGSDARPIIVPSNVRFLGGDLGHNNLYLLENFTVRGWWVPLYSDEKFRTRLPSNVIATFIEKEEAEKKRFIASHEAQTLAKRAS